MPRIAFLTTHLSGSGHLVRMLALARAVTGAGGQVLVISGGRPLDHVAAEGIDLVQIPPLSVPDFDFANPLGPDGAPADAALMAARRAAIAAALARFAPDVLVTETWPLGRRRLTDEFEAAIAAAGRAARVCSVRDVPEPPSSPARLAEAAARLERFDAVLVHGDPALLPLSASWPLPDHLGPRVHHTGYVGDTWSSGCAKGQWVLASGGGGRLGRPLMEVVLNAAANSPRIWHLILGGHDAEREAQDFHFPQYGIFAHPPVPHFRRLLAGTACSVSLCGYNTAMDLAACTSPALIVPFELHGEREQRLRAEAIAGALGAQVLALDGLTPEALNDAVEAAIARGPRRPAGIATGGAEAAAARLMALAAGRHG